MCNLYSLTTNVKAIRDLFAVSHNRAAAFDARPSIFPGHMAPIVRATSDGERELVSMSWGFVLPQPGKAPRRVTNTRDDKLESRFWHESLLKRRCLVPASSFCEPHDGTKPTRWVWFEQAKAEPRTPFAFAGIRRRHVGPIKKDGPSIELDVYSFLTTEPNSATQGINHERCPLLLTEQDQWDQWLNGSGESALALVKPIAGASIRIVKEGFDKADSGRA